ncbi:hypothetical protein MRB53_029089 [Persea americana]|uniref:Uncharacterized protein n=1 Tax=Persea americana TaxID=3435 RepID=A0ACC2KHX2_PERAE|nr:hypothetical protein MRB53_029089 [Persea americana]
MGYQKSEKRGGIADPKREIASKRMEICEFWEMGYGKEQKGERSEIGGEELVGMNRTSKKTSADIFAGKSLSGAWKCFPCFCLFYKRKPGVW